MHGRVKVRTTAEQEALKKIEREKKTAQYKVAMRLIFQKRSDRIWDDELLGVIERVVLQNPDINTLWNIRREAFENNDCYEVSPNGRPQEERVERLTRELTLTENCLRENPKSYGVWHHRCWLIDRLPEPNWKTELALCAKCLNLDERNFHCWDYRQHLVKKAGISDAEEFDFSTSKILNNFSNYSSWHYRSKILSKMFPDESGELPIRADKHKEELDLVMNATFTDPNDSSAWFYQRWLLDCSKTRVNALSRARITPATATIILLNDARIDTKNGFTLLKNGQPVEGISWQSSNNREYSKAWFASLPYRLDNPTSVQRVAVKFEDNVYEFCCTSSEDSWIYKMKCSASGVHDKSQLKEQMTNYQQLSELEPNNKWSLLTGIYLMKNYDANEYNAKIVEDLGALTRIDQLRSNYYKDMRSKCLMEYTLHNTWEKESEDELCRSIDLSGLGLTILSNEHHLCLFEEINLDENELGDSLHRLVALPRCRILSLSGNRIRSLGRLPTLPELETLSLRKNELSSLEEILDLVGRHEKLARLDLRDNPIGQVDAATAKLSSFATRLEITLD